jgi:hypothetical protein
MAKGVPLAPFNLGLTAEWPDVPVHFIDVVDEPAFSVRKDNVGTFREFGPHALHPHRDHDRGADWNRSHAEFGLCRPPSLKRLTRVATMVALPSRQQFGHRATAMRTRLSEVSICDRKNVITYTLNVVKEMFLVPATCS